MAKKKKKSNKKAGASQPSGPGTHSTGPSEPIKASPPKGPNASGPSGGAPPSEGLSPLPGLIPRLIMLAALGFGTWVVYRVTARGLDLKYGEAAADALCTISETINCNEVLNSSYAEVGGIPIALFQAANLAAIFLWLMLTVVGSDRMKRLAMPYAFGMASLSVLASVGLFVISKVEIGSICPYCAMLYATNLTLFATSWWASGEGFGKVVGRLFKGLGNMSLLVPSVGVWALVVAGTFSIYSVQKDGLIRDMVAAQEAKQAEIAELEAQGFKFPRVLDEDPFTGPANAEVTVVEFADFQCGYCKRLSYELERVKEDYKDQVKFVFKHYPMNTACNPHVKNDRHPYACGASIAAECAHRQDKFWDYHDILFKNQHRLGKSDLRHYAEEVGLDLTAFDTCLRDPTVEEALRRDMDEAERLDIHGTPRTYIDGEEIRGVRPAEFLAQRLTKALGEAKVRTQRDQEAMKSAQSKVKSAPTAVQVKAQGKTIKIDAFEASIGDDGAAISAPLVAPANRINWFKAKDACEAAGKRLCTQEEWMTACAGEAPVDNDGDGKYDDDYIEGNAYPYGEVYNYSYCFVLGDLERHEPVPTGRNALCTTPTGIYDMVGNVGEWVGATEDDAVLMGGGYHFEDKGRCTLVQDTYGPGWAQRYSGFRCCEDVN